MAKKSQTTGQPKTRKSVESGAKKTGGSKSKREYRSRADREQQLQRRIIIGTIIVSVVLVVALAAVVVYDRFIVPNIAVATVNGESITVAQFQERFRLERTLVNQQLAGVVNQLRNFGMDDQTILQQLQNTPPYSTWLNEVNFPDQLGQRVLDDMVNEAVIAQEAKAKGITVSDQQIELSKEDYFGYSPTATALAARDLTPTETVEPTNTPTPYVSPTPSPTPTLTPTPTVNPEATVEVTPETTVEPTQVLPTLPPTATLTADELLTGYQDTASNYLDFLSSDANVSAGFVAEIFQREALRKAVRDVVITDITRSTTYVNARHILVDTEEEAQDIFAALQAGEPFSDLARASSKDTNSGAQGGELGWAAADTYVEAFKNAVLNSNIGEIIGPVQSDFGYHIIQVRAREDRDRSDTELENAKNQAFDQWLKDQRTAAGDKIAIYDNWSNYIPQ